MFSIRFQTSENTPPPYAHAIEIKGKITQNQEFEIDFELAYLNREELQIEEIEEEGFSENDNFSWKGSLPKVWSDIFFGTLKTSKSLKINALKDFQDYFEIEFEGKTFYPDNSEEWKYLIEEIKQAVFEKAEIESPLNLHFIKINSQTRTEYQLQASFIDREIFVKIDQNYTAKIGWSELNFILKNTFSGDFISEIASEKEPSKSGFFINIGDGFWYELGKSWQIQSNKINQVFRLFES